MLQCYNWRVWLVFFVIVFSFFAADQSLTEYDPINVAYGSPLTFAQSTDVPYPVGMFENNYHTRSDENTAEQPYTSAAGDDLPNTFDQMSHNQVTDSDKPYTFTPTELKSESPEIDVKCEENKEENVTFVIENKYNALEAMSNRASTVTNAVSCPNEKGAMLPVTSLKQEKIDFTDLNMIYADKMNPYCIAPEKDTAFCCEFCTKSFREEYKLKNHIQTCIYTLGKQYLCSECGKSFKRKDRLKIHKQMHTGVKPYTCSTCGKGFSRSYNLKEHSRIHMGETPYKCNVSGKSLATNTSLRDHNRIHTGKKPHECNVCGKSFTSSGNLTVHQRTHSGEKPYKCNACEQSFTSNGALKVHKLVHTGEKPHKCTLCGNSFTTSSKLRNHNQIHTGEKPYECNVCGKSFTTSSKLKDHNRMHTGEKPYTCSICGKGFSRSDNLKKHSLIHMGETPYKCNVCMKYFTTNTSLREHKRIHTVKNHMSATYVGNHLHQVIT